MPAHPPRVLIVGGTGLIGSALAADLAAAGCAVSATGRRAASSRPPGYDLVPYDLDSGDPRFLSALAPDCAVLCAAVTAMQACEEDADAAYRVNVTRTVALAEALLARGAFVVFLSSNTVFDGRSPWPDEAAPHHPEVVYGRHKSEAERRLAALPGAGEKLAIVRLSKVVTGDGGVVGRFLADLGAGVPCAALSDLMLCPVSLDYVVRGVSAIVQRRLPGIFHLSGAAELSYAGFAAALAAHLGVAGDLVRPVDLETAGIATPFRPLHPGLGMAATRERLGIGPQSLEDVVRSVAGTSGSCYESTGIP
jgi:dTDP-4-dehydrorhamnose reductase